MSNPSRPPKDFTLTQLSLAVAPDSWMPDGYDLKARAYKKAENVIEVLSGLDMELSRSFVIPREHTVDERVRLSKGPAMALAKTGVPSARVRSAFAKALINRAYGALPAEGPFGKEAVGKAMAGKVYVDAGTEGALGRIALAYPRVSDRPRAPVSAAEASGAMERCGLRMDQLPLPALRPYPLIAQEGEASITVNPNADNGFPVLGKWTTPDAAVMCMELAVAVRRELERVEDVGAWLRQAEADRPWLVACRGKAKGDYYSQEKVVEARMRFYNAFPRQMLMNMQIATQVLEQNSSNILSGVGHSGIGISLVRGGCGDLVKALDAQLRKDGYAYVHVGDDSWVIIRRGGELIMFALDCSNFDLTQHGDVTREVHVAIRKQLERIDVKAARLWEAYARERLVVVVGAHVRRWKHAGPSGMPLQSKVNDVLMDVMINRLLAKLGGTELLTAARVDLAVREAAASMGFVAKLEQFGVTRAQSLYEALERNPFLFIGYYFHVRDGEVRVFSDVPRTYAQVPFPTMKWHKTGRDLAIMEAMRLGSISLNLGRPLAELDESFDAFRREAVAHVKRAIEIFGDTDDARIRWAVGENVFGAEVVPSLSGLLKAMERPIEWLWTKELPMPHVSSFLPLDYKSWADEVIEEEKREAELVGLSIARPLPDLSVRPARITQSREPTHPPTIANSGRPPPTAVWGPNKAPRDTTEGAPSRRARRRDGIAMRDFHQMLEEEEIDLGSDEDEYA